MSTDDLDPVHLTERIEVRSAVSEALRSLPPLERELIVMTQYERETLQKSARRLGISGPYAESYLARATVSLRGQLLGWA